MVSISCSDPDHACQRGRDGGAPFVYAIVVLRSVRGTAQTGTAVPQVSVTVAFAFVLASVVVFLVYIDHIAQAIRAASIVTRIGDETREVLERTHPPDAEARPPLPVPDTPGWSVASVDPGVVQQVDDRALARLAEDHGVTICLLRAVGEFVPAGAALLEVHGDGRVDDQALRAAVHLGKERSLDEDVAFGLRQLVDIAERALSPGINDPTTAVQVVDQLHDLLRRLVSRPLTPRQQHDRAGRLTVHVPQPDLANHVALAVDEIAHWGADVPRIQRRLGVMLRDLHDAAIPAHRRTVAVALESFSSHPPEPDRASFPEATDTGLR